MVFEERDLRRISAIALVLLLGVLVVLLIKPVFLMVMGGLILAYLFSPVNKLVKKVVKEKNTSAAIVTLLSAAIILVPLWFVFPIIIEQLFEIIKTSQKSCDLFEYENFALIIFLVIGFEPKTLPIKIILLVRLLKRCLAHI